ncbi:helix-turn-helix domain-containing protein [Amaricoccus sp.]|uniref:helix-turn-helix domain-containing protein n=1 Tax=Amaricoccus sp. TaxID=1872485 RepID=UPI001B3CAE57|nr:helix-turn-helix domain-containing protein [Amaricoccus sp.]MBP7241612.1 helix-turn-helix domain-containing protein [Amaricoccus sp.]
MQKQACIWLSPADRATLDGWVADRTTPQKLVQRARIVLMSAAGAGTMAIVRALGKSKRTVGPWQERYLAQGIEGLPRDASRLGRKPLSAAVIKRDGPRRWHQPHQRAAAAKRWPSRASPTPRRRRSGSSGTCRPRPPRSGGGWPWLWPVACNDVPAAHERWTRRVTFAIHDAARLVGAPPAIDDHGAAGNQSRCVG